MTPRRRLAILSVFFTAAALAAGCSTGGEVVSGPVTPVQLGGADITDPADLLLSLAQSWDNADWESLAAFANPNVVEVAMEWRDDDGSVAITEENVDVVLEGCVELGAGVTRCQLIYAPPEGSGLIFDAIYESTGSGLKLTDLQFTGDAG